MVNPAHNNGTINLELINENTALVNIHGKQYRATFHNWGNLTDVKIAKIRQQLQATVEAAIPDPKPKIIVKKDAIINGGVSAALDKADKQALKALFALSTKGATENTAPVGNNRNNGNIPPPPAGGNGTVPAKNKKQVKLEEVKKTEEIQFNESNFQKILGVISKEIHSGKKSEYGINGVCAVRTFEVLTDLINLKGSSKAKEVIASLSPERMLCLKLGIFLREEDQETFEKYAKQFKINESESVYVSRLLFTKSTLQPKDLYLEKLCTRAAQFQKYILSADSIENQALENKLASLVNHETGKSETPVPNEVVKADNALLVKFVEDLNTGLGRGTKKKPIEKKNEDRAKKNFESYLADTAVAWSRAQFQTTPWVKTNGWFSWLFS